MREGGTLGFFCQHRYVETSEHKKGSWEIRSQMADMDKKQQESVEKNMTKLPDVLPPDESLLKGEGHDCLSSGQVS